MNVDVYWHESAVSRENRERLNGHPGCVVWFTGLSGSGKSTVANLVDAKLHQMSWHTMLLDGDNIRHGLNASPQLLSACGDEYAQRFGLGFGPEDRRENIRRIAAVSQLFASAGLVTLTAFVSPYRGDRLQAREFIESEGRSGDFIEVFVDAPLEVCEQRDPKGLYKRARAGEITGFTGIDAPYEAPDSAELVLSAGASSADELANQVVEYLTRRQT